MESHPKGTGEGLRMATRVTTVVSDDLDSEVTEDVQEVRFAIHGNEYAVDLGTANRGALEAALGEFIAVARPVSGKAAARPAKMDAKQIRAWAREQGLPVNPRGRVAADIVARWRESQGS